MVPLSPGLVGDYWWWGTDPLWTESDWLSAAAFRQTLKQQEHSMNFTHPECPHEANGRSCLFVLKCCSLKAGRKTINCVSLRVFCCCFIIKIVIPTVDNIQRAVWSFVHIFVSVNCMQNATCSVIKVTPKWFYDCLIWTMQWSQSNESSENEA